jgi:hypothetical protein
MTSADLAPVANRSWAKGGDGEQELSARSIYARLNNR